MNIRSDLAGVVVRGESLVSLLGVNDSQTGCSINCTSNADNTQAAKLGALASIRLVTSLLSILGAASIIVSVIFKRQVRSPKVHPIFMLSIADSLLATLWVAGGIIYLGGMSQHKTSCLFVSLFTVILECVTINLTFVYALFAHAHIKQTNLCTILTSFSRPDHGWPLRKVFSVYFAAWVLPVLITVLPFTVIVSDNDMLYRVDQCSCGCVPRFANIEPKAHWVKTSPDSPVNVYRTQLRQLVVSYTAIIAAHYLIIFPLLVIYYYRILYYIKKLKRVNDEQREGHSFYGAAALIVRGHSQAKQRVILFLTIFVINGFCNLVLAMVLMIHLSVELIKNEVARMQNTLRTSLVAIALVQSITVPLQGFLNAIVYGWTREDFLYIMVSSSRQEHSTNFASNYINAAEISDHDESTVFESSEQVYSPRSRSRQDTPETHSRGPSGTYDFSKVT